MFTAYKYSIHKNPRKSRIKIELPKTFTQFSPVYHKTITKGCYNIGTVKETGQGPEADPQRAERKNTMARLGYVVEVFEERAWEENNDLIEVAYITTQEQFRKFLLENGNAKYNSEEMIDGINHLYYMV